MTEITYKLTTQKKNMMNINNLEPFLVEVKLTGNKYRVRIIQAERKE